MGVETGDMVAEVLFGPFGEGVLEVRKRSDAGPSIFSWRAHDSKDLKDFVNLAITREQRFAVDHFAKDTTNGPHIYASRVLTSTEKNFGSSVPQGNDFMSVGTKRDAKSTSKAKVGELEVTFLVDEQVLRLEIAM